ncbi:MAG: hypothetical protein LAO24_23140 [Acidobacteriia bacterium]|nr:hypothetical protein [Terriglobia bacterium]
MKPIRILIALSLGLMLSGCGSGSHTRLIDGMWNAQVSNPDGTSAFSFQAVLTEASGTQVNVTGLVFMVPASCFPSETSQNASFTRTGEVHGEVTGTFGMTVTTTFPTENNVLTLQGNVSGTVISGTWSLTGGTVPCNGSGNFQMTEVPAL